MTSFSLPTATADLLKEAAALGSVASTYTLRGRDHRPSDLSCSPLVVFSGATLQEHAIMLQRLESAKMRILSDLAELSRQELDVMTLHETRIRQMEEEESSSQAAFREACSMIFRCEEELGAMQTSRIHDRKEYEEEITALEREQEELAALDADLRKLQSSLVEREARVSEKKRESVRTMETAMMSLQRLRAGANTTLTADVQRVADRPRVVTSSLDAQTSKRVPSSSLTFSSPPHAARAASSALGEDSATSPLSRLRPQPRFISPPRATAAYDRVTEISFAGSTAGVKDGDGSAAGQASSSVPPAGYYAGGYRTVSPARSSTVGAIRYVPTAPTISPRRVTISPSRLTRIGGAAGLSPIQQRSVVSSSAVLSSGHRAISPPSSSAVASSLLSLHALIASGQTDAAIALIRSKPHSVNSLDDANNTPLHTACAARAPSISVLRELLLAGSSTAALNADGLSPYHLAAMNEADSTHAVKRFLIFKAAVNPNQRTAKGHTVAHLCASNDRYLDNLKYFTTVGVDFDVLANVAVPSSSPLDGINRGDVDESATGVASPVRAPKLRPIDQARANGAAAARCLRFLESLPKTA